MNRYKNIISNIIEKQNKILSESKIGTVFNEERDYREYYTTSSGAQRYTNPYLGCRSWTKEDSIHTEYSSQIHKYEFDLEHTV